MRPYVCACADHRCDAPGIQPLTSPDDGSVAFYADRCARPLILIGYVVAFEATCKV